MLQLEEDTTGLRKRLKTKADIEDHCAFVAALQPKLHHTIRCIDQPTEGTCVTYAFSLLDQYRPLWIELESITFLNTKSSDAPARNFIRWLLDKRRLTEIYDNAPPNVLAMYFSGEKWTHAGVTLEGHRIRSKWGNHAVFEHGLCEVPAIYGKTIRFYVLPDIEGAATLLFQFLCWRQKANHPIEISRLRSICGLPP
jgi:hypothetical protein